MPLRQAHRPHLPHRPHVQVLRLLGFWLAFLDCHSVEAQESAAAHAAAARDTFPSIPMLKVEFASGVVALETETTGTTTPTMIVKTVKRIRSTMDLQMMMALTLDLTIPNPASGTTTIRGTMKMVTTRLATMMVATTGTGTKTRQEIHLFNGGKIRALEQALEEAQGKADQLEKDLRMAQDQLAKYEDAIRSAAVAMSPRESNALEILAEATTDVLPSEILPGAVFEIEVWDMFRKGVGNRVSEFAQSLSYALQEFLKCPSVAKISTRKEPWIGPGNRIIDSDVHTIVFTTKCLCELEVCCGAVHTLLAQAFGDLSPKVTTTDFDKESRSATLKVIIS